MPEQTRSHATASARGTAGAPTVTVGVRRDRQYVSHRGDTRYFGIDLVASSRPPGTDATRTPVSIGIVIDRSGSMSGRKIEVAKRAAIEVVNRLHDGDEIAVTIFNSVVEVLLPRSVVDDAVRARVRNLVASVSAYGGTALHEGWLRGCQAIAPEGGAASGRIARCYLLTDGQANEGVTDPQAIALDVAAARAEFGVVTSTFGIGDYDQDILAPMATAGGGQFHNLRNPDEIVRTFLGELGEAVAVEAGAVAIEIDHDVRATIDVISGLWVRDGRPGTADGVAGRRVTTLDVGDLIGSESRTVVVGVAHPAGELGANLIATTRVTWRVPGSDETCASEWHEVAWTYAPDEACDAEPIDETVARDAGLHLMERYRRESSRSSRRGDLDVSGTLFDSSQDVLRDLVDASPALMSRMARFDTDMRSFSAAPISDAEAKERISTADRLRQGKRDLRGGPETPTR